MATPDAGASSETRPRKIFWNEEKKRIFGDSVLYITLGAREEPGRVKVLDGLDELNEINELVRQTLPTLARHFDGKALEGLKQANPWLAVFEPGSMPDWKEAISDFIDNGPAFLDVLASFTDLTRFDTLIGIMLQADITTYTPLLLEIRDALDLEKERDEDVGTVDERVARQSTKLTDDILDVDTAKGVTRSRIDALLRNAYKAEERRQSYSKVDLGKLTYKWVFRVLWESRDYGRRLSMVGDPIEEHIDEIDIKRGFFNYIRELNQLLRNMKKERVWVDYTKRVQSFVRQVGCAEVHDEPEENIAELRVFHTTTIRYFAKLQEQYLEKVHEVKKLRRHITALEFRHLLEHLPGMTLDEEAGPRWGKFWKKALEDEVNDHQKGATRVSGHALKSIVEKRNPRRGVQDTEENFTEGANGLLNTTGKTLYSLLNDEIHHYRGDKYEIGDDDSWTEVVRDVLRALKPLETNVDAVTHEVDWAAERQRYATSVPGTKE